MLSGIIGMGIGDLGVYAALPLLGSRITVLMTQCLAAPIAAVGEWLWLGTSNWEPSYWMSSRNLAVTLQHIPSGDWNAIDFRVDQKPFDDPNVRKALRVAVDRQALTDVVLGKDGGVPTCDTPVWSGDPYRWNGDCGQDIEGAKKLLADAGYPDGIDIEVFTSDVEDHMVDLVTAYQEQVKAAGIRVKLTMADSSGYWDDVWMKEPAFVDSWGQRPAAQVLNEVYRSTATWNVTGAKDTTLDGMLEIGRAHV